jgi:chorismate mutase
MSQEAASIIPHLAVHRRVGFQVSVVLGHDEVQVSSHIANLVNRLVFVAKRHPQAL